MKKRIVSNQILKTWHLLLIIIILLIIFGFIYFGSAQISKSPAYSGKEIGTNPLSNQIFEINEQLSTKREKEEIITLLEERKKALRKLIVEDPEEALQIEPVPEITINQLSNEEKETYLESRETKTGILGIEIEDYFEENYFKKNYYLTNENEELKLFGNVPDAPGAELTVEGIVIEELMTMGGGNIGNGGGASAEMIYRSDYNTTQLIGPQRTILVVGRFIGSSYAPILSIEDAENKLFGDQENSLDHYYRENSFNQISFYGDVFGPYEINETWNSSSYIVFEKILQAAVDEGVNFSDYDRLIIAHPGTEDMHWSGVSSVGKRNVAIPGSSDGQIPPSIAYISIAKIKEWLRTSNPRCVLHELGHSLGIKHAMRLRCKLDGGYYENPISDSCTPQTYQDYINVMGGSTKSYFHSTHKVEAGWMPLENTIKNTGGTFTIYPATLNPSELPEGEQNTQLLKIPIHFENTILEGHRKNVLAVDFRQQIGYDSEFHELYVNNTLETQGVHIRYAREADGFYFTGTETGLVVAEPNIFQVDDDYQTWVHRHAFLPGETFIDEYNGVTITVNEVTNEYATVTVEKIDPFATDEPEIHLNFDETDWKTNSGSYNPQFYNSLETKDGAVHNTAEGTMSFDGDSSINISSLGRYVSGAIIKDYKFTLSFLVKPAIQESKLVRVGPVQSISRTNTETTAEIRFAEDIYYPWETIYLTGPSISLNNYSHIAVTFNGTIIKFYINGELVDSETEHETGGPLSELFFYSFDLEVILGNSWWGYNGGLVGEIDEFYLFNRGLSQEEIIILAGAETPVPQLTISLEYPLDREILNTNQVTFEATITNNDNSNCSLFVDNIQTGNTLEYPEGNIVLGPFQFEDGDHSWYIECTSENETHTSNIRTFEINTTEPPIDTEPPIIVAFLLTSNETIFDPEEVIGMIAAISESNPSHLTLNVNNTPTLNETYNSFPKHFNWTVDEIYKSSNISLSITVYDSFGNEANSTEIIVEVTGNVTEEPVPDDPGDRNSGNGGGGSNGGSYNSNDQEDEEDEEVFLEEEIEMQLFPDENIIESVRLSIPTEDHFQLTTEIDEEIIELIKVEDQPIIDKYRDILIDISIPTDYAPGVYTGEVRFNIEKIELSADNSPKVTGEVILANILRYITGYTVLQGEETDIGFNYVLELSIEVKDQTNKPVNLKVTPKKSELNTDEDIELNIEIGNNLPEEKEIDLSISLLDSALENIKGQSDYSLEVEEEYLDTKNLDLYEKLVPGKYVVKGVAKHSSAEEGSGVISMSKLSVNKPFLNYKLFGIKMKYYLLVYALLLLTYTIYLIYNYTKKPKSKAKSRHPKPRQQKKRPK